MADKIKRKVSESKDIRSFFRSPPRKKHIPNENENQESRKAPGSGTSGETADKQENKSEKSEISSRTESSETDLKSTPSCSQEGKRSECDSSSKKGDSSEKDKGKGKARLFNSKWCREYKWLHYDEKSDSMTCTLCLKHNKHNTLTSECRNFRTSTLSRHADSADHKAAVVADSLTGTLEKAVSHVFDEKEEAVMRAMNIAFFMAKEDIAIDKFEKMIRFHEYMKTPGFESLKVWKSVSYKSDKSCVDFMESIATAIRQRIFDRIAASPFVSILCDESTDISVTKKLSVYVKIVHPETLQPATLFVCNEEIESGTGAGIYKKIKSIPGLKDIPREKILGLGTDGAKVMTGMGIGLTGFMARDNPMIVNYHCVAHRLALVTSQAADEVPFLVDYQTVLTGIFYYFKSSANRCNKLIDTQAILQDPKLKVKEVHQVRWMSIYLAVETVYKVLDSLLSYFAQETDPKAKGYAKKMIQYDFIAATYLLMDILPITTEVCLLFQKENLDVSLAKVCIENCRKQLCDVKEGKTTHLDLLQKDHLTLIKGKVVFKGNHVVQGKQNIDSIKVKFVDAILANLERRFPDNDSNIIYAFAVLSMRPISVISKEDRESWGNDQLEVLIKQYGEEKQSKPTNDQPQVTSQPVVDAEATRTEWGLLKQLVIQEGYPRDRMSTLYNLISKHYKDEFPNILKLAALALTAPIHTSDCERGFSAQNSVKTSLRNRLGAKTVDNLLMIKIEGGEVEEFDFPAALRIWRSSKERKIFLKKD